MACALRRYGVTDSVMHNEDAPHYPLIVHNSLQKQAVQKSPRQPSMHTAPAFMILTNEAVIYTSN
ncbi:MAG: hypothetical protein P8X74_06075 [Reinekea sp.]|jgi:hypothetical protein